MAWNFMNMILRLLSFVLPLFGSFVSGFFGRFLGSEINFSFLGLLISFFVIFSALSGLYHFLLKKKRKKSAMILVVLIYIILLSFSYILCNSVLTLLSATALYAAFFHFQIGPSSSPNHSPASSFFEGVTDELKTYFKDLGEEVTQPINERENTLTPDAAGPSHEGGNDPQIPYLKAPSPGGPVEILHIPDETPCPPSIEEGDKAVKPSLFIPEIPPYRGKDPEVPQTDIQLSNPLVVDEAKNRLVNTFRNLFKNSTGESAPSFSRCKAIFSNENDAYAPICLKAELNRRGANSAAFKWILDQIR